MKSKKIYPVILSGGSGTRLWPMSRSTMPKQFLPLLSDKSMFIDTLERVSDTTTFNSPIIVGNEEHNHLVQAQLAEAGIEPDAIILEPVAKNTAPAIALAAHHILNKESDSIMLVMPSDHVIKADETFYNAIELAHESCNKGKMVTFGIHPGHPETGYGYIKTGTAFLNDYDTAAFELDSFVEKPCREEAQNMLNQGGFLWNSGIFMFSAIQYINELSENEPDMVVEVSRAYLHAVTSGKEVRPEFRHFSASPSNSVDYAVMERTSNAVVVESRFDWSDAGSWQSLWENESRDENANVVKGDVVVKDSTGCYIRGAQRLISTLGVEDLVIVDTEDALLIANKNSTQDVKKVVDELNISVRDEARLPATVRRPWGTYKSVDQGSKHQVKHITVEPGGILSKQYHNHRAEHWIVVNGVAHVEVGTNELMLGPNDSVFIKKGQVHRLANHGNETLILIEVQYGKYLGEDDIVRLEDKYGRVDVNPAMMPIDATGPTQLSLVH